MALDYDKTTDLVGLQDRTRDRNVTVFVPVAVHNIDAALLKYAETIDATLIGQIENMISAIEGELEVKIFQADKEIEAEYLALENELTILSEKMTTEEARLALRAELEDYVHLVREYENSVKAMLQAAKEFAAEVEKEGVTLEKLRAMLAVRKEATRLVQLQSEIAIEKYRAAEVEVEIIKAQLDVVRSNLKVIQANIDVEEVGVKVVEAGVEQAMTEAERSTLAADIATILAEIELKKIAPVKYEAEKAELEVEGESGIGRFNLQSSIVQQQKTDAANMEGMFKQIGSMISLLLALEIAGENIRMMEQVGIPRAALDQESSSGSADAASDSAAKITIAKERLKAVEARVYGEASVSEAHAWLKALMAEAHAEVKKDEANQTINSTMNTTQTVTSEQNKDMTEYISS